MRPEIIIHNSVSIDGSLTGFMPDMELHYRIAGDYKPDAHLIGADTIIAGNEMFGGTIPEEQESDFIQPERDKDLPFWVVTDTRGRLRGMLHTCRRFEFCRDVIVLLSESSPSDYLKHLEERNYRYNISGTDRADLENAFAVLWEKYGITRILTDTGRQLGNLLLNKRLVKELSLLVHPLIIGGRALSMFSDLTTIPDLKLQKSEHFENGCVWNVYTL